MVLEQLYIHRQKQTSKQRISNKTSHHLHNECKSTKSLEIKIKQNLWDLNLGRGLSLNTSSTIMKGKFDKLDFTKITTFSL